MSLARLTVGVCVAACLLASAGLSKSLLGMSFLGRLAKVEAANGRLILRP